MSFVQSDSIEKANEKGALKLTKLCETVPTYTI